MLGFDLAVIAVILLSALLGFWRGLVYEALSLLGWLAAWMVARLFAADAIPYMPAALGSETIKIVAAFIALFVGTLIVSGIVSWLLSKLVKLVGLGLLDSLLGTFFGILRGTLVLLVLVVLAGLTSVPQQAFWRDARSSKLLESMALLSRPWLPAIVAQRMSYRDSNSEKLKISNEKIKVRSEI